MVDAWTLRGSLCLPVTQSCRKKSGQPSDQELGREMQEHPFSVTGPHQPRIVNSPLGNYKEQSFGWLVRALLTCLSNNIYIFFSYILCELDTCANHR
jgi:hypothetical protein